MDNVRLKGGWVHVHWIPAHTGVPDNGMADILAKETKGHRGKELPMNNNIQATGWPALLATTKQSFRSLTKEKWEQAWDRLTYSAVHMKTIPYASKSVMTL